MNGKIILLVKVLFYFDNRLKRLSNPLFAILLFIVPYFVVITRYLFKIFFYISGIELYTQQDNNFIIIILLNLKA